MSDSDSDEGGGLLPPIHRAAIAGDLEALRRELEAGVSPDCLCYSGGSQYTPLIIVCSSGTTYGPGFGGSDDIRLQAVKILLEAGATPGHIEGLPQKRPLCFAAFLGNVAIVKLLIAAGADVTHADTQDGWTALHAAVSRGRARNASCAAALLEAGAAVDAGYGYGIMRQTPLVRAVETYGYSRSSIIPVLLRFGARIDMTRLERYSGIASHAYAYLAKVHAAGGWKRYAQAHAARLAPIFAKAFPHARLPPELVSHIVGLWAHVGYY